VLHENAQSFDQDSRAVSRKSVTVYRRECEHPKSTQIRICNPQDRQFWSFERFNVSGLHLYLPLMLRFRRAALTEGYQMGKVKVPAASAVVLRVTRVNRTEIPSRCQRVAESPLQYCICSAVGAPGRIAACKLQDATFRLSQRIYQTPIRSPRPIF